MEMETSDPPHLENKRRRIGLRDFDSRSPEEVSKLLASDMRRKAFAYLDTVTPFRQAQREQKKQIALEFLSRRIVSQEILKNYPMVYIGSRFDIEYPLVLGARDIVLADPVFKSEQAEGQVAARIEQLTGVAPESTGNIIHFDFEFEAGKSEHVSVALVAEEYPITQPENETCIPAETGSVLLFASKSEKGVVGADPHMLEKIIPGGVIVDGPDVVTKDPDTKSMRREQLGRMRPVR